MKYTTIQYPDLSIEIQLAAFEQENAASEFYAIFDFNQRQTNSAQQFNLLEKALQRLQESCELSGSILVWKRYFVSDAINQASFIECDRPEAISIVQQPPLNGNKTALFAYFVSSAELTKQTDGCVIMKRPHYAHLYHTQMHERSKDVENQTTAIFERYKNSLQQYSCTLKEHAVRTWIYVQDVDVQYAGMVTARNDIFTGEGLTPDTHFIASTGIEGRYVYPEVLMLMDAYAIHGIDPKQIKYLQAPTHLNPTYEYGVAFERGTAIDYGDRRHVYISGTASINNKGEVVHLQDIEKQISRTLENVEVLLSEADTRMTDVAQMIVYLRDTADYEVVKNYFDKQHTQIPKVIVWAPVCRPGWLIEIECIAVKEMKNAGLMPF